MSPRKRQAALNAIEAVGHRYSRQRQRAGRRHAGPYGWTVHHLLSSWQAKSWPADIDAFSRSENVGLCRPGQPGHPADFDLRLRILPHWLDVRH
jgi:hypothetical protein